MSVLQTCPHGSGDKASGWTAQNPSKQIRPVLHCWHLPAQGLPTPRFPLTHIFPRHCNVAAQLFPSEHCSPQADNLLWTAIGEPVDRRRRRRSLSLGRQRNRPTFNPFLSLRRQTNGFLHLRHQPPHELSNPLKIAPFGQSKSGAPRTGSPVVSTLRASIGIGAKSKVGCAWTSKQARFTASTPIKNRTIV